MSMSRRVQITLSRSKPVVLMSVVGLFLVGLITAITYQSVVGGIVALLVGAILCAMGLWAAFLEEDDPSSEEGIRITQPTHFNINHRVKVKLTDLGRAIYDEHLNLRYKEIEWALGDRGATTVVNSTRSDPDADGYYTFQMYELMHIFGVQHMSGCATSVDIPFETEIILLPN